MKPKLSSSPSVLGARRAPACRALSCSLNYYCRTVLCRAIYTKLVAIRLATIGRRYHWSHTSGRSVRLYTGECVVGQQHGTLGPCKSHMPRPAHLSQKPKPTVILGALVHWLMRNNLLKKKDGYSIEQCSKDFGCSKTILKRVISGKKQKGGREYKREAEAREHSDAPPAEEERPEQPIAPVAKDAPAADEEIIIDLQESVCNLCEEEYAPEEVLINHYTMQHPEWVQNIVCRYCYEILQGYPNYLEHVDKHNADNCKCLLCKKVCRTLSKLGKHMKKSHPFSEKDDDPGDQAEDAPKDTGEVEDTAQQEQVTGDPDELPDLVLDKPRIQPPQPPSAAAGVPTPGMPEKEKEKKGHKEASEKYKVVCEACNRYFQDAYTRSGHINTYHKEIIRQCGFCKSGFSVPVGLQ